MAYIDPKYYAKVYRDFRALDPNAHREIVRYYEKEEKTILGLPFDEFFDCVFPAVHELLDFVESLVIVDGFFLFGQDHFAESFPLVLSDRVLSFKKE